MDVGGCLATVWKIISSRCSTWNAHSFSTIQRNVRHGNRTNTVSWDGIKFPAWVTVSVRPCCQPTSLQHHSPPNKHNHCLIALRTLPQWLCRLTDGLLLNASWPCWSCISLNPFYQFLSHVALICFAYVLAHLMCWGVEAWKLCKWRHMMRASAHVSAAGSHQMHGAR